MMIYFTGEQYKLRYPDLMAAGVDAFQHYVQHGSKEGREVAFPDGWTRDGYLEANPDVKADPFWGDKPELHWLIDGAKNGRPYRKAPTPGSWSPPTTPGMHEICQLPGPFFMSGLRVPGGLLLGTYRPAKLYFYDGAFHEEFSGPYESVYMLHMTPTGPIFTTERPAGVWKKKDGQWRNVFQRPEIDSLGFDVWPYRGGLILYTADNISLTHQKIYVGDINGENWRLLREHNGHFPQMCTDGQTYWLVGEKDRYPYIMHENGSQVMLDRTYKDQIINYASVKGGLFTLGLHNIDPVIVHDGKRRNGYVTYFDGQHHIEGIDCLPPYIMQTDISPSGERFAVASIWNETGYPNPELVRSQDGRRPWAKVANVPMPSVQTFDWGDGGAYLFGGKYGEYGKVCFYRP